MRTAFTTGFRHRPLQATALALLSALVTTCVVFAPQYDRAMQQAVTHVELGRTPVPVRGLRLTSSGRFDQYEDRFHPPLALRSLAGLLPSSARHSYARPIGALTADASGYPPTAASSGLLQWRQGQCDHLPIVSGRCPTATREIAVSTADARTFGLAVGSVVTMDARAVGGLHPSQPTFTVTVVGLYRQPHVGWWFGQLLTGSSGQVASLNPKVLQSDVWVTSAATFHDASVPTLDEEVSHVDYRLLAPRVRVDRLTSLDRTVVGLTRRAQREQRLQSVRVYSGLPGIAADVRHQGRQAQVTVPLLMVQLALLGVVVLWLVLGAATEQRRPEVAVAVLRGRGRAGARSFLLGELLPVVLVGVPLGCAAALGLGWLTRDVLLPGSAPLELRAATWWALTASVVTLVLLTVAAALVVTREPVERLLRRVPERRTGWRVGVAEAVVGAAALTAVVAFASGGLTGPGALAAPLLLALVVGLVLSHLTAPVSGRIGHRLLTRGRVVAAVSVLDAARTPATRRAVAVVTVATALLVFATTALAVGARNRDLAAEQVAGAAVTAPVKGNDLLAVRRVLSEVDPHGRRATPVVFIDPPAQGSQQTVAAVPAALRRIALFPGRHQTPPDLAALDPPTVPPLRIRGDSLGVRIVTRGLRAPGGAVLQLALVDHDGTPGTATLGPLPTGAGELGRDASVLLHCETGCALTGISVITEPGDSAHGSIELSHLTTSAGGVPTSVRLGPASQWTRLRDRSRGTVFPTSPDGSSLYLSVATVTKLTTMTQRWVPQYLPTLVTGRLPDDALRTRRGTDTDATYDATGIDGQQRPAVAAGRLARIPRAGPRAALVNLDVLMRGTGIVDPTARIEVWFAHADPALEHRVATALRARGSGLGRPLTLPEVRRRYDRSTSAWSLALGLVVGIAALLLALLVVAVLAATTWRARSRDLAALRLSGLRAGEVRRIAGLAQLPVLVLAVVAGAASGLVGAHLSLPRVPLFASAPAVSTLDLSVPWLVVALSAALALVLLLAAGWFAGTAIAHRADLHRVRETL